MNKSVQTLVLAFWSGIAVPSALAASPEELIEFGRWKQARAAVEQQLKGNPNSAKLHFELAQIRRTFGDLGGAHSEVERALGIDSGRAEYHLLLANIESDQADTANVLRQAALAHSIKKELETALKLDPKGVDPRYGLMQYYWLAPYVAGGDKQKARALADEVSKLDPLIGCGAHAWLAAQENRFAEVESQYRRAIEINSKDYRARILLGGFYASDAQKKYPQAEEQLKIALSLQPGRAQSYVELARIYAQQERWKDLDDVLAQSEKNVGDNLTPYFMAARTLLATGKDLPRAERYFRKYLTQEPEAGAPGWALAHWRLGQLFERLGRRQDAVNELQAALQLDGQLVEARKDLKRIRG